MKIILSKDDIENIIKEYYNMEAVATQKDGTILIDTTLERITNEKNDMHVLNSKLKNNPIYTPFSIPVPYKSKL